jgi:methionyl-tRNA formyltransferase
MSKISVAFFGSHPLGEWCLSYLTDHDDVSVELVVTYPDDEQNWWDGDLHETATELDHTVVPLEQVREVLEYDINYLISVYYPNILDAELLAHPTENAVNLHQAELPRYRGSNVFTHSILNAREDDYWKHGTTFHVMAESVDAGDIIDRKFVEITEDDTAWSLYQKVREASKRLFEESLPVLLEREVGEVRTEQQEFDGPRYFYKKSSIDGLKEIDLRTVRSDNVEVYDRIRALDFPPHEPAYTEIGGNRIYLTKDGYQNRQ